jgi:hypothetical protein
MGNDFQILWKLANKVGHFGQNFLFGRIVNRICGFLLRYFVDQQLQYVQKVWQIPKSVSQLSGIDFQTLPDQTLEEKGHEKLSGLLDLTIGYVFIDANQVRLGANDQRLVDEKTERVELYGKGENDAVGLLHFVFVTGEWQPHFDACRAAVEPERVVQIWVQKFGVGLLVANDPVVFYTGRYDYRGQ